MAKTRRYSLNKVDGINPYDHIETAKDRRGNDIIKKDGTPLQYIPTKYKEIWFRTIYPDGFAGAVRIEDVHANEVCESIIYKATVAKPDGTVLAELEHHETMWDRAERDKIAAKVQTIALGKALSLAGFGCEIEFELNALSEGETEMEPETKPVSAPRKKEVRDETISEAEVEELIKSIDSSFAIEETEKVEEAKAEKKTEEAKTETPEEDVDAKIKELLQTTLEIVDPKASIGLKTMEGWTLEKVYNAQPTFGRNVLKSERVQKHISKENVEAVRYIEAHK